MKADPRTESDVLTVLNTYAEAYAKKDMDTILSLLTPDSDLVFIGTDVNEKCRGPEEMKALLERDFSIAEDISWEWGDRSVSMAGNVAWAWIDCLGEAVVKGQKMNLPMRITAVLEKRDDKWLVAQMHNSVPVMRQM